MTRSHDPYVHTRPGPHPLWRLWGWPLAMAALSIVGLMAALMYDGAGDLLSWIALGIPVAVMLWFGWLRRKPRTAPGDGRG